ncbi:hypothetical protein SAMN04488564_118150 [Lentzea waywayandensis]|uniref:DUF2637 domain-containing protein n=1 Tax=Lentzea waywayandensis TaxID=84724 RepID=A0A1I6FHC0_9PSEU|nr:hypothetical protein [Lentzea waywayandensis]SFR29349.1 hypothetical protein SAMN04488564_118150 [Lentzea waywayandensis]
MQANDSDEINEAAGVTKRVVGLRRKKAESAHLRGLVDDPDMAAVRLEGQRRAITRGMWFFLALGLAFTTTSVQAFLAGDRAKTDPLWWGAWLAEPMLAGLLITLLMFEAEILSRGIEVDEPWVRRLKRILLSSTLLMSVWPTLMPLWTAGARFDLGNTAIHVIVPVVVFAVAEVMPVIQHKFNEAIARAYREARTQAATTIASAPPTMPAVPSKRLRLPESLLKPVRVKAAEVAASGRELTADDVREVIKVAPEMAAQIAAEVQQRNGHAFT